MDIISKARELGQMMVDSPQMERYNQAEVALESNREAKQLLDQYRQKQFQFVRESKGGLSREELEAKRQVLQEEYNKLNENEIVREYITAKGEMDKLVKTVNEVITYTITGETGGCSPKKCSSCGGGCGK